MLSPKRHLKPDDDLHSLPDAPLISEHTTRAAKLKARQEAKAEAARIKAEKKVQAQADAQFAAEARSAKLKARQEARAEAARIKVEQKAQAAAEAKTARARAEQAAP